MSYDDPKPAADATASDKPGTPVYKRMLDLFEAEGLNDHVHHEAPAFRRTLEKLLDLPIVGDVRGEGFFYGIELVKDKVTKETFDEIGRAHV